MVLDPFTALSVAGNIVQFVDFSSKLFYASREISRSASGTTKDNKDLSNITTHLQRLCDQLIVSRTLVSHHPGLPPEDIVLKNLAHDCKAAGEELLVALRSLELNGQGKKSKWDNFRVALATVWKKGDIDAMSRRLESYKSMLALHLAQHAKRYDVSLSELESANKRLGTELNGKIELLKQDLDLMIRQLLHDFKEQLQQNKVHYDRRVDEWLKEKDRETPQSTDWPPEKLSEIAVSSHEVSMDLKILHSLQFKTIKTRQSRIVKAHPETFKWIFESTFSQWLESQESMYWISGKPGSGKSTLMKFLVHNPETIEHLRIWAGRRRIITASFFFWIAGTDMQKSQEGLLRSILYEILAKSPRLISEVLPTRWEDVLMYPSGLEVVPWTHQELLDAFVRLQEHCLSSVAFCFFIDGLDEYDGHHPDLIDVLRTFCMSSNIKICFSSRPWNVFEANFGNDSIKRINIQDLTKSDLRLYVKDHLEERRDYQEMQLQDSRCHELIEEIIEKAQGVFLWVFLVVRSLIEGLQNSDRIIDLQRRLRAFPSDLHDYFMLIFTSLEPIYRAQTARAFQVTLSASQPLSVFNHWFLDWEEEGNSLATTSLLQAVDDATLIRRKNEMERRLTGRCKCLLEVTEDESEDVSHRYRVEFLHRTVRDFMKTEDMQRLLLKWTGNSFKAHLAICKSTVAEIETLKVKREDLKRPSPLYYLFQQLLHHAREMELKNEQSPVELLDRIGSFISAQIRILEPNYRSLPIKTRVPFWVNHVRVGKDAMLMHAIEANLNIYARRKFTDNPGLARISGLWRDFLYMLADHKDDTPRKTHSLVKRCVAHGADQQILKRHVFNILPRPEAEDLVKQLESKRKKIKIFLFKSLKL